jgi:hypothetical protein
MLMAEELHGVLKAPCKSCPYRKDVPSGIWAEEEYRKLPSYDGDIPEQLVKGAFSLFFCHQQNDALCSGWLGCHEPRNLLAMRLHYRQVKPETFDYTTKIPLFASGAEAAEHGIKDIDAPSEGAKKAVIKLLRQKMRKIRAE